jgi:hypothetical protein
MQMSASITVKHGMTVDDLRAVLDNVPDSATVSVKTHAGDRWEMDSHSMTFSWEA